MMKRYLQPTSFLDYETPVIKQLVSGLEDLPGKKKQAIALYEKVRDDWRYNPYRISLNQETYRASVIAVRKEAHCIEKAILLAAGLRALNIPARLQLAKVKNHIGIERLIEKFGSSELTPHGMVNLFLGGTWLKVTPAFNKELCARCQVDPLNFDGENDSMLQQFNRDGQAFMQYLEDYGTFDDVPIDFIFENFRLHYPQIYEKNKGRMEISL